MSSLRAGAARVDITPEVGTPLAGHWSPRPAEGIDTPLMVHALVLDDGTTRLAIVALDLIVICGHDVAEARRRIHERTGLPPEHILVAASHTHEGPYPAPLLGRETGPDPSYMARVVDAIVEGVVEAERQLVEAEAGFGATDVPGLCHNRRQLKDGEVYNPWMLSGEERRTLPSAGPTDDEVILLGVRAIDGTPIAALWNFSLHTHAFSRRRVHGDYPWVVGEGLREAIGESLVSVFTPGACADINRRIDVEAETIAARLRDALLELYRDLPFSRDVPLRNEVRPFTAALRDCTVFQEGEISRKLPSALAVAREEWEILREAGERSVSTSLHAISIGDLALAAVPGEYFVGLGLDVKARSPFPRTALVELADDYIGYIPWSQAYAEGGYELFTVRSSKVAEGVGEAMADELVAMLGDLSGPARPFGEVSSGQD